VGVARQYCGTLGKVENCQVGVFAGYASRHGYALVDKRLFLPEVWWTDAYAARRTRCNVPEALTLQSKPQLAAAMLQAIAQEGPYRSSTWWQIVSMARARTFSTPWTRVSASRHLSRFLRTPAAGSSAPAQRTRPTAIKETSAPSVWSSPPLTPQAPWRRWRPACRGRVGISARFPKARKGQLPTRLLANT
jgi:hypothetical protein